MKVINLADKLSQFSSHWDPHVVADYNDNDVMVVKFKGEFPFHLHEETDDFFLVLEGEMVMDFEQGDSQTVKAGELIDHPQTHGPPPPRDGRMQGAADRAQGRAQHR